MKKITVRSVESWTDEELMALMAQRDNMKMVLIKSGNATDSKSCTHSETKCQKQIRKREVGVKK